MSISPGVAGTSTGDALDNVVWHALAGAHADLALANGVARRYDPDVSVFAAMPDASSASWDDLAALLRGGWGLLTAPWIEAPPTGWTRDYLGPAHQMVLPPDAPLAADAQTEVRPLERADVPAMVELVAMTEPGPFTARTIELGGYLGLFDGPVLVAMAGHRLRVPGYVEISAVCTRPDAQGRGLGAAITTAVARAIRAEGATPFLHVTVENESARRVYERLGFVTRTMVNFLATRPPR